MGGTLASNLAGEFSFTLALALALFFLGALAWALDHRRRLWLPAVLLAAVVMSHLVVAIFAVLAAIVIWLTRRGPIPNLPRFAAIGAVGVLLTAVWSVPLLATLGYTTDMRYEPIDHYVAYLFPGYLWWLLPFLAAAIIGGFVEWRRSTLAVGAITVLAGLLFRFWYQLPNSPAWNLRLIPFWYLGLFLLAALGATEIIRGVTSFAVRSVETQWWAPGGEDGEDGDEDADGPEAGRTRIEDAGRPGVAAPPALPMVRAVTIAVLVALFATVALVRVDQSRGFLPFWVKWNYTGYQDTTGKEQGVAKAWPEYQRIIATMSSLPPGHALWEPSSAIDKYGTTLALELLPYFTHGRIGSMEGLYFEASATTPYHFLTVATLTADGSASNPVRGLPYRTLADFKLGVRYLQLLGVRYYMAQSAATKQVAESNPSLRQRRVGARHRRHRSLRVERVPGRRLAARRATRIPAGRHDRRGERTELEMRRDRTPAGDSAEPGRVHAVGMRRRAVVQRPGRAQPSAHGRRAERVEAGADDECAARAVRNPTPEGARHQDS